MKSPSPCFQGPGPFLIHCHYFLLTICFATSGQHPGKAVKKKPKISLVGGKNEGKSTHRDSKEGNTEIKAEIHEKDFSFPRNDLISKIESFEMTHKTDKS